MRLSHSDYIINDEALAYMRDRSLARPVVDRLAERPHKRLPDLQAWSAHLGALGITALKVNRTPC